MKNIGLITNGFLAHLLYYLSSYVLSIYILYIHIEYVYIAISN